MKKTLFFLLLLSLLSCHRSNFSDNSPESITEAPRPQEEPVTHNWSENSDDVSADALLDDFEGDAYEVLVTDSNGAIADAKVKNEKPAKTWKRSQKTANMATLFIGDQEQLPLKGSQIAVQLDGFRARVLIDCFFENDRNNQLEGTFKMKLPQGASPYYFAFGETVYIDKDKEEKLPFVQAKDVVFTEETIEEMRSESWSAPKVARVVAKEKAAFAYGNTVRKQVDPALAEWGGADVYNCRVFPLMPEKLHRIVIGYDVNLTQVGDDWVYQLDIPASEEPMLVDVSVAQFRDVLSVVDPAQDVQMSDGNQVFRLTNPTEKAITIRYKGAKNIAIKSPVQTDKPSYFAAAISPELPSSQETQTSEQAILALDISLSSNPDKFNAWLKLAEAILQNNQRTIKRFNVLMFNIESFWWEEGWVENTPEHIQRFLDYANTLALEGASDLSHALASIQKAKWAQNQNNNIFLLSDGSDTWGESDSYAMANNIPSGNRLFAYNTGMSGTHIQKLTQLTRTTGGALFAVTSESEVTKASTAFTTKLWKIEQISLSGAKDILIAGRPTYLFAGQNLMIAGRGSISNSANIKLTISQDGVNKEVSIPLQAVIESELTSRTFGQIATEMLEEFDYATEKKSIAYAKHFAVPGKTCSLLMLETEEDYKEYNITATEDAYVVNSTLVTEIVADVLKEMKAVLSSAKSQFAQWLNKISRMNGVAFEIPASMEMLVENTPEAAFRVAQLSLSSKSVSKKELTPAYLEVLNASELDYDAVNLEAQSRAKKQGSHDALKALSSLVEKNPGNSVLARDVAYTAQDWGLDAQAYFLFKRVLSSRPYEPQTYLAIAKTLSKVGKNELALLYYEIALQGGWQPRFGEFKRIATLDYFHFLTHIKNQKGFRHATYVQSRTQTLQGEMTETTADLMLVISWNTDNTDVDLHVIEPTGEECYYQHRETKIGGYLTQDVTQGYGPEMYILKEAKAGDYKVRVKYFSSDRNRASTRTKVYATIYQNWGKENESVKTQVVSLADKKQMHDIVTIEVE